MLIETDVVVTMDGDARVLEPGWVRVEGARIVAVGGGEVPAGDPGEGRLRAGVVMPGLVSAHQHLLDVVARGATFGPTFLDWLLGLYYDRLVDMTPEDCHAATALALAETVRSGVTTIVDCWGPGGNDAGRLLACAEASLEAHRESGARVVFARMFAEHVPDPWRGYPTTFPIDALCAPADLALAQTADLASRYCIEGGRLRVTPSPELPELVTPEGFRDALALAEELDVVLPMHLCPSPESRAACGPDDLAAMGVLGDRLLGAHCSAVDEHDISVLARAGVGAAHCPSSNLALHSAVTPVVALRRAGMDVGLGLDNASLNPNLDLFAETRQAVLAARARGDELDAGSGLAMATIEGARAIGLAGEIGSLEPGKRADLVLLDTSGAHWSSRESWMTALVEHARPSDVHTVIVDGRVISARP